MDCRFHPFIVALLYLLFMLPVSVLKTLSHAGLAHVRLALTHMHSRIYPHRHREVQYYVCVNVLECVQRVWCHCVTAHCNCSTYIARLERCSVLVWWLSSICQIGPEEESSSPIRANSGWIWMLSDSCLIWFSCMWKESICVEMFV